MISKRPIITFFALVALGGGIFAAGLCTAGRIEANKAAASARVLAAHRLVARRVFSDTRNDTLLNFVPLRTSLEKRFASLNVPHSFDFEYLPTGTNVRIGDGQELVGASLLKLPVVMDLYRASERKLLNLDTTVTITPDVLNDEFGDLYKRGVGAKITLRDAARLALQQSDNTAILLIQRALKATSMTADETSLAAVDAEFKVEDNTVLINSESYTSILKCLYYACYNNPDNSQEILNDLATSNFHDRIAKPVPDSIPVAHKIGENDQVLSQSDCGIFYVPKRPYILCLMLGTSEQDAQAIMSEISKTTYEAVINN